jgi:GNAT superfamily N-acetyltransferase
MMTQSPYYAIWDQERIVGGVLAVDEGAGHYYLKRIFVDPDVQNRGAASAALAFIEKALPARRWTLHTPYRSYSNQRFYEKRGYRKIGELHPDDVENVTDDFLLFHYEKIMPDTT